MNKTNKILLVIASLLGVFVTLPIWLYLVYKMMVLTGATELMWFLFWVYVPASMAVGIIGNLIKSKVLD